MVTCLDSVPATRFQLGETPNTAKHTTSRHPHPSDGSKAFLPAWMSGIQASVGGLVVSDVGEIGAMAQRTEEIRKILKWDIATYRDILKIRILRYGSLMELQ